MKCLCCGKTFSDNSNNYDNNSNWHKKCIKSFFGTNTMPELDISENQLIEIANSAVNKGYTVPGIQKKLSLHLSAGINTKLTIVDYPTGYILKPQTEEYLMLPELEDLTMRLADIAGIKTVPHALVKMNEEFAFITKRIDRYIKGSSVNKYAMEDFCQVSNRLTQDKYKASYESCGRIINKYSVHSGLDLSELFLRIAFSFIAGNSDMHLKNLSLIETSPASRNFCLSPAYDLLPVNIVMPEDTEQLALTLNGKKKNIHRKDFLKFAESCNIPIKSANAMLDKLCSLQKDFLVQCDNSYIPDNIKIQIKELIATRTESIALKQSHLM